MKAMTKQQLAILLFSPKYFDVLGKISTFAASLTASRQIGKKLLQQYIHTKV